MSDYLQFSDEVRRIHKRFTDTFTVHNYSWDDNGGSNEYSDGDWTESSTTVEASIREDTTTFDNNASGSDLEYDVEIWVAPDEINLTVGGEDETRSTEFEDGQGRRWRAVGFHDESSLYRVQCREVQ